MARPPSGDRLPRSANGPIGGPLDTSTAASEGGAGDEAASGRDMAAERFDAARACDGAEFVIRAAGQRLRAAEHRAQAAEQHRVAAEDRQTAAADRRRAAAEHRRALADLELLACRIAGAEVDSLTRAHTPTAGRLELDQELARCRITDALLVVVCIAVAEAPAPAGVGSRWMGDELLGSVVGTIKDHLRVYDLVIRHGAVELLCAISNTTPTDVCERFCAIADAVADVPGGARISTGFAELRADETATQLIARAHGELTCARHC